MNRVIAGAVGLAAVGAVVVGCSNDKPAASNNTTSAKVSTGGNTAVKVDGADLAGLDLNSVTCVKQGGQITVASGAVGGQQGLGLVMSDEATPKVQSLGLVYDGSALSVSDSMGVKVGSAEVKVDGSTYTISGEASGADLKNPMAGMITKPFTITVSCS
ncbi:lipoprotein LpqH [Mycobacterium sp. 155]|uniref:lipoprotein LpqH n=1 Tax=Mycobacterium sp. 155 TaxID=1157943 RepID=UPI0004768696|nr:lipoprotein LpqH [Mycobacterium sp. 155]